MATGSYTGSAATYYTLDKDASPRRIAVSVDYQAKKASLEGVNEIALSSTSTNTLAPAIRILSNNTTSGGLAAKLYSCKIYTGATLTRDFVPCKNPSGQAGLYDLVSGAFYGNAGTGTFTAGPAV